MTPGSACAAGYDTELVAHLEQVFGAGLLSSGGERALSRMFEGVPLPGAAMLDVGSGLGGFAELLARSHPGARIIGIDVEPMLVERSRERAARGGLSDRLSYRWMPAEGALPVEDACFDIVYAKEAILHVADKPALFAEIRRATRPGGTLVILDWARTRKRCSARMRRFLAMDGLPFHLCGVLDYRRMLRGAGFATARVDDHSAHLLAETVEALELVMAQRAAIAARRSDREAETLIESWRLQHALLATRAIRQLRLIATAH